MNDRYLQPLIEDLCFAGERRKMAFVSGPRQCGKTTMARIMLGKRPGGVYHTWDDIEFRRMWAKSPKTIIPAGDSPFVVLDEIHKSPGWKSTLKGVWDTIEARAAIVVTGSARLSVYRKGGDSLLGRYLPFRLHPFSLAEVVGRKAPTPDEALDLLVGHADDKTCRTSDALDAMMAYGAFPEPFLQQDERRARLWRRNRVEAVIREDLRDLTRIPELGRIEILAALLPERVGSPLSLNSLREDLEVSHDSIRRWLEWLKELYYVFEVKPYSRKINRGLKKEGKHYFWDFAEVPESGPRFENLVSCHLLKCCHYWTDAGFGEFDLCYLRDKQKREIDFLVTRDGKPWLPVEAKASDTTPSPHWATFLPQIGCETGMQLVLQPGVREKFRVGAGTVVIRSAGSALACLV